MARAGDDDARPIPQGRRGPSSTPRPAPRQAPRPAPRPTPSPGPRQPPGPAEDVDVFDVRQARRPAPPRRPVPGTPVRPAAGRPIQRSVPAQRPARPDERTAYRTSPERPSAPPAPPTERAPRPWRRYAVVAVLAVLAYVAVLIAAPIHAWSGVARVDASPAGARPVAGDGHTYLLVGSDSREGLTSAERKTLGTGSVAGKRTDTIILVHVPSGGGKSVLVSLPRDSWVPVPGHGRQKINAAYAIGGPKLLVQTVEGVTDLRIDGYLEIGLGGFARLVDALGGVYLCVPFDMNDKKAHINLKKGCQTLAGAPALGFVRARYSDPRGDIGRADRQRQFLGAVMKQTATPSTVLWAPTWWSVTHAGVAGLTVGEDTAVLDAYRIAQAMRGVSKGETLSLVVPLKTTSGWENGQSVVLWDRERALHLFQLLRDGTPIEAPPAGTDGKPSAG